MTSNSVPSEKQIRPLALFGPSGSGKSTLLRKLFLDFPDKFGFSISHTTRKPRPLEEHGKHYYFVTRDEMLEEIEQGKFIEHVEFNKNFYGTSKKAIEDVHNAGQVCVLDIDCKGVKLIKESSALNPWYVFINPPSIDVLKARLQSRGTENPDELEGRLAAAVEEITYGTASGISHLIITNEELDEAYKSLKEFIEECVLVQEQH